MTKIKKQLTAILEDYPKASICYHSKDVKKYEFPTMEMIYNEILEVENGDYDKTDNVLKNSPHTLDDITMEWNHPYSISKAITPTDWVKENKFWPTVGRIDNAYGDRNLVCSCLPIEEYEN